MGVRDTGTLGALIRRRREAAGLTQEELAQRTGLSVRTISDLECGRVTQPRRSSMTLLAAVLGLPAGRPVTAGAEIGWSWAHGAESPRQLPMAVSCFTGRDAELATLTGTLHERCAAGMVISVIGGTAGVGKTALAIQWAHQVAGQFPDGQLYVNLRGYDPGLAVPAAEALAGFLSALGVPGPQIPAEETGRAAAFRSALAGRRVLIVLDNARDGEHVRPLLPGDPACVVVVTSRDTLAGLVARDGARRLLLDVLPPGDAVALLRTLIGPRAEAEPEMASRLASLCCHLPLALRVAAEMAVARPGLPLAALAGELEGQGRLDALEAGGDPATAVRVVFSWSRGYLSPGAARAFRLVALHPGADFDAHAVAALTGTSYPAACQALAELSRASLLGSAGQDRYGMHDLLRAYAIELGAAHDPASSRRAALTRLFDYYLDTACHAAGILFPADAPVPAAGPGAAAAAVAADEPAARAWLDAERANLTAVASFASRHGWPRHATDLSAALFRYLHAGGFLADALVIHGAAARGATRAGDRAGEAAAVNNVGTVYSQLGRCREAEQHFQRALRRSRDVGDHLGQLRALLNLSMVYRLMGAYPDATDCTRQALELSRATGNRLREARALALLGEIHLRQGRFRPGAAVLAQAAEAMRAVDDPAFLPVALLGLSEIEVRRGRYYQARQHVEEARATARKIGHVILEAEAIALLGFADLREGRHHQANQRLHQALAAFHDAGFSTDEARVLCYIGEHDLQLGHPAEAVGRYQQALIIYERITEPSGEAEAHNGLGAAAFTQGDLRHARTHHEAALAIADRIDALDQQARAHEGLGNLDAAVGGASSARLHWQQALARYTDMDVPDASRIQAKLDGTQSPSTMD